MQVRRPQRFRRRSRAGRRVGCRRPGRWLAVLLLLLAPLPAFGQDRGAGAPEVRAVEFVGARAFNKELLATAIMTQASGCRLPGPFPACLFGLMRDPRYLDEAVLQADLLRLRLFYYQRGYRETRIDVETVPEDDGVRVVFVVDEGPPVRIRQIQTMGAAEGFTSEEPLEIPLREGDPLDLVRYEAVRDTLRNRLRNDGYPRAEVLASYFIPADSPYDARVRYDVLPGERARFGAVEVVGAEDISPTVVRRMLTFRPGDPYREDELPRSQRSLYGLGVFRHIEVRPRLEEADTVVPITVQVSEGKVHRVRLGVGLNTVDAVNAEGRWASRNFLGGARRLEVRGQISNILASQLDSLRLFGTPVFNTGKGEFGKLNGLLAVDFSQPWLFSPYNALNVGVYVERRSLPDVFVRRAAGGYLSFTRTLAPRTSLSLGYRPEQTSLDAEDLFFCSNYLVCATQDIEVLRMAHLLLPFTASFTQDRSNGLFNPTGGHRIQLDAEYDPGALGSNFAYARLAADVRWYQELREGIVVAARLSPGWAAAMEGSSDGAALGVHPQKRFFAGGPNSVRGFEQYHLGPKVLTVDAAGVLAAPRSEGGAGCTPLEINTGTCDASVLVADTLPNRFDVRPVGGTAMLEGNIELRFPVGSSKVRGTAFVDFGQVWADTREMDLGDVVWTPGVGIRYFSPIGPIRLDVGYNTQGTEELSVITTKVDVCSESDGTRVCQGPSAEPLAPGSTVRNRSQLLRLNDPVSWNPRAGSFFDRLRIHFSIGQAF